MPLTIVQESQILRALRASWKDLREVQQSAQEHRSKWLHERTDALASQMKTYRSKALRQIAAENATNTMFRRIRPISKGTQSRAITRVKVPVHTWYYSPTGDDFFKHMKWAFYSHSREGSIDGEASIFRTQTTRKPIPTNNIYPATIESSNSGITMLNYDKGNTNIWQEVTCT